MIGNLLKRNKEITHVYLDPEIDYVFCFKKETVIEEKDCDMYEYNLECDKNDDFWGRTHRKGSLSGAFISGRGSMLNECDYCLKKGKAVKYALSTEAIKLFNKQYKESPFGLKED